MWGRGVLAPAVAALALAGCGGDDDEDGVAPPGPAPAVSCQPRQEGTGTRVVVRQRWKPGDKRELTVERSVEGVAASGPARGSAKGEIRVLRAGGPRSSLRYRTGTYYPVGMGEIPPDVAKKLEEEIPGPKLDYATDRDGAFLEVENRAALKRQAIRIGEAAERLGALDEIPPEARARIRELAGTDVFLDQYAIDPILVHRPYGLVLEEGVPVEAREPMSSPFGGEPVPARATYNLTSTKNERGCVTIDATFTPRAADVRRAFLRAMSRFEPNERLDPAKIAALNATQEMHFEYDPDTGWIARAEQSLRLTNGPAETTQRTVVSLR